MKVLKWNKVTKHKSTKARNDENDENDENDDEAVPRRSSVLVQPIATIL